MLLKNDSIILRKKLLTLLDGLAENHIIYICAPAGYGKTVAIRQWLNKDTRAKAAVCFDEYDNDPTRFCQRFCSALRYCQPDNVQLNEIVSHPAFSGAPDEFSIHAIDLLSDKERSVIVVDDLHFITNERVLRLLLIFLMRLPDVFQIVLISRHDLPPRYSDLLMKGHLACINAEHLLFSSDEIKLLYKNSGNSVTTEQADDICRFTGGWAIGIGALLLSGGSPSGKSLDYLEDFICHNVWDRWDEDTRNFMLCTAMARVMHPSLCESLTETANSGKMLNELMRSGAFIFQTSDGLYHYHILFQNFLKQKAEECGDSFIIPLLNKEGEWYLERNDFYSAVDCFIRSGNIDGIARCFVMQESDVSKENFIESLMSIIQFPIIHEVADKYPYFFSIMAWAAFAGGSAENMMRYADLFYMRYPEVMEKDITHAHYILLMGLIDFRVRLQYMGDNALALKSLVGVAAGGRGSLAMNMPMLHRGTRDFSELCGDDLVSNIETLKSQIGYIFGEEMDLLADTLKAGLLYEKGCLDKAYIHALSAAAKIKDYFPPESKFCVLAALICILDALGQPDEADKVSERLKNIIEQDKAYSLNRNFNALICRRKLWNGNMKAAQEWLTEHKWTLGKSISFFDIYITLTTCRANIAVGEYDVAIIMLTKVLELAQTYKRPLDIIEAEILLSISYWKKKRRFQQEAMNHLEAAVSLAHGYEYTQIFANEGSELSGMLRRLQNSIEQRRNAELPPSNFIRLLYLKALEYQGSGLTSGQPESSVRYTEKQKSVMMLLCEGKSYREIAEVMGIKLPTLRSHISLIYKKLDVTGENEAVVKIKTLGILDEV